MKYVGLSHKNWFSPVKIGIGQVKNWRFFNQFYRQYMVKMKFEMEKCPIKNLGYSRRLTSRNPPSYCPPSRQWLSAAWQAVGDRHLLLLLCPCPGLHILIQKNKSLACDWTANSQFPSPGLGHEWIPADSYSRYRQTCIINTQQTHSLYHQAQIKKGSFPILLA